MSIISVHCTLLKKVYGKSLGTVGRRNLFGLSLGSPEVKEQRYTLLKTINSPPTDVYNVVSEVSQYYKFIPYCTESFVEKRNLLDGKPTIAGLRVGFKQYDEKFVCEVSCKDLLADRDFTVEANSLSHNLFHLLYSKWTIRPHPRRPQTTEVELSLRFKFKSRLYNAVSSIFAKSVTKLVMDAFEKRVFELKRLDPLKSVSSSSSSSSRDY
ncbi:hypothetical protein NCAS_0D02070 [Naumovozyma castellii]|uniref:Coenzyme Q-binding protein COQ10 START domain-containing protein n=1 Tax=Naumovozyma castellii TaxID=27288 RepID=G0VDZ8_NAUCA|nr:hypothetical protein NCAS_0D02070 [Naumovozyma castellii CBS 4309]CCC69788.1 hypothetical protein NCAS_0D02070 [Naumovozyma castellii CBS 4309]